VLSQQMAGIGSRGLAALVDSLITLIIILAMIFGALALSLVSVTAGAFGPALIAVVVVASVVPVLYYVSFELATGGRSLGKLIFGLRVVDLEGVPVGLSDSLVRNLVRIVDFLPLLYGFGVITMFAGRQPRRLGDLAAGTVVVHDHGLRPLQADHQRWLTPVLTLDPGPPLTALDRCGRFELDLVQEFLSRPGLSPDRRASVASDLLVALSARAGVPLSAWGTALDPVALVERVYIQLRQRLTGP